MATAARSATTDTAILTRLVLPDAADLSVAGAEGLLAIHLSTADAERMHQLLQ